MPITVGPPDTWQWISNRPTAIKEVSDLELIHWPEDCQSRFREQCTINGHHDEYCQTYRASIEYPDHPEFNRYEPLWCICDFI